MAGWSVPGVVNPREIREDPIGRRVVARHRITRKSVAITYLASELLVDAEFRTRFAQEFARLARVREARVHRYFECDHGAAVIGDHVSGTPLRAVLLEHGALSTEAALVVLKDSLLAIAACHEAGLAHGDIKPEDVILSSVGQVRLVDFGLWTSNGRRLLARSTPFYLAPEQWSDCPATQAGDVYAAVVTFFECLVGAPPFHANGVAELLAKHERSAPPVEVVPEPVRDLVLRGLAKDPRSRPEARSLLAHVGDLAGRVVGCGWEPRGRRELATLVANRSALPDVFVPAQRNGGAGWEYRRPVRLAGVMGGALALAVGLASPPLAVILPEGSIFGSGGRSPVLAFPEPDHDAAPMRVVTNGPLADRALMPAAKAGTAGPVAKARPSAPSISVSKIQSAPYGQPAPGRLNPHLDSAAQSQSTQGQSTPAPPACTQQLPDHTPCTATNPEQSISGDRGTSGDTGTASDPSQVSIPVSLPVPVEVPVQLPAVQLLAPAPIPIWKKIQPQKDNPTPRDAQIWTDSQGSGMQAQTQSPDTTVKKTERTNWTGNSSHSSSGNPGSGNPGSGNPRNR